MMELQQVDAVEVTLVVDNFVDVLMAGSEGVRRFPLAFDWSDGDQLIAEHGFSALVTVEAGGRRSSVLYDGGLTPKGLRQNLDVMQVAADDLRAIVISHGHVDHHGGLEGLAARLGRRLPLIIHPGAWRERKVRFPGGQELRLPPPSMADLEREGLEVVSERGPTLLVDGRVLVSGQVERVTDFETGFPIHLAQAPGNGEWEPDPLILDDQNLIVDVAGKGLVIVSGCRSRGSSVACTCPGRSSSRSSSRPSARSPLSEWDGWSRGIAPVGKRRTSSPGACRRRSCSPRLARSSASETHRPGTRPEVLNPVLDR
jgi:7,8-dihydropterin-6-yl-methyl-4-(beta-D-ribofuranosyl)aminobenzene 5'-phosphate synthase